MVNKHQPIGIFDSGVGGLTVAHEVMHALPAERVVYLGDTARVPYGTRGGAVITKFALELVDILLAKQVKCLVIACNSISATCFDAIVQHSPVPVIGVIEPTVEAAVAVSANGRIGVLGTRATVRSESYQKHIQQRRPGATVFQQACPLFVPVVEEGHATTEVARLLAEEYLAPLRAAGVDTVILGCTHYPVLEQTIRAAVGESVHLVGSGTAIAVAVAQRLAGLRVLSDRLRGPHEFLFTDLSEPVHEMTDQYRDATIESRVAEVALAI